MSLVEAAVREEFEDEEHIARLELFVDMIDNIVDRGKGKGRRGAAWVVYGTCAVSTNMRHVRA